MKKSFKYIIIVSVLATVNLYSREYFSESARGITAGDFLNLDINPRVIALGGAQTAVVDDASAIYSNPAGLIEIPKFSAMLSRASYISGIEYNFLSSAYRLSYDKVIALSLMMTDLGTIKRTDIDQNLLGDFTPRDIVISIGYSKGITEFSDKDTDVSMGVVYKHINSKIYNSAKATAFDLGIKVFKFTYIPYKLSFIVANIGSGLRYYQESNKLPFKIKLGGSIYPFPSLMFAGDLVIPNNDSYYLNFGTELNLKLSENTSLALRAGLNTQKARNDLGGFAFGFGLNLKFFSMDYSFAPMENLGNTSFFSLSFNLPVKEDVFERKEKSIYTSIPKQKAE
jgi:hypothetical protein